jgi:hypothetical protein
MARETCTNPLKVFKMLWSEYAGNASPGTTEVTLTGEWAGESFAFMIKWFVVVQSFGNCCNCL